MSHSTVVCVWVQAERLAELEEQREAEEKEEEESNNPMLVGQLER